MQSPFQIVTAALHLSLIVLGVGPGDKVVVTSYSWISTANVIELVGAEPIFVDIDPQTFNMDPKALHNTLTRLSGDDLRKVKALIPVHTFGQVADMPALAKIARDHRIPVIEDAACALGAKWNNHHAGAWSDLSCYSFHPRKAITTGEGGMITTNSSDFARTLRALRNHGQDPMATGPNFIMAGYNLRMTEMQGALGLVQMPKLNSIVASRQAKAHIYNDLLIESGAEIPFVPPESDPVYQSYVVTVRSHRDELIRSMKAQGIEVGIGTWHMPLTTHFKNRYGYKPGDFPNADQVFGTTLTLPLHDQLNLDDQTFIVATLTKEIKERV